MGLPGRIIPSSIDCPGGVSQRRSQSLIPFDLTDLALWLEFTAAGPVDRSSYNHTITEVNSPTYVDSGFAGIKAMNCTDSGEYLSVNHAIFGATGDLTVAGWVYIDPEHVGWADSCIGNLSNGGFTATTGSFYSRASYNVSGPLQAGTSLSAGQWIFALLRISFSLQKHQLWINGVLVGEIGISAESARFIRTYFYVGSNLTGRVSIAYDFNRAISDSEISTLYNNGTPLMFNQITPA